MHQIKMESILKEREELDLIKERLEKTDKERERLKATVTKLIPFNNFFNWESEEKEMSSLTVSMQYKVFLYNSGFCIRIAQFVNVNTGMGWSGPAPYRPLNITGLLSI